MSAAQDNAQGLPTFFYLEPNGVTLSVDRALGKESNSLRSLDHEQIGALTLFVLYWSHGVLTWAECLLLASRGNKRVERRLVASLKLFSVTPIRVLSAVA